MLHYGHKLYVFILLLFSIYMMLYGVALFQGLNWVEASSLEQWVPTCSIALSIYVFRWFITETLSIRSYDGH